METFAAYGAPAIMIVLGYALVWWARLSPPLFDKIASLSLNLFHNQKHAPDKRV